MSRTILTNFSPSVFLISLLCAISPPAKPINISGEHRAYCRPYALILHSLYRR